jgi:hypothetical protein
MRRVDGIRLKQPSRRLRTAEQLSEISLDVNWIIKNGSGANSTQAQTEERPR